MIIHTKLDFFKDRIFTIYSFRNHLPRFTIRFTIFYPKIRFTIFEFFIPEFSSVHVCLGHLVHSSPRTNTSSKPFHTHSMFTLTLKPLLFLPKGLLYYPFYLQFCYKMQGTSVPGHPARVSFHFLALFSLHASLDSVHSNGMGGGKKVVAFYPHLLIE